jgi:hypothetical protein
MFLKLKESGGISFRPEESVSLSIVHVGPHLVVVVCILPFIDYLFGVCVIDFPLSLDNGRSPRGYINQRLHIHFRAPDDERCAAQNALSLQ